VAQSSAKQCGYGEYRNAIVAPAGEQDEAEPRVCLRACPGYTYPGSEHEPASSFTLVVACGVALAAALLAWGAGRGNWLAPDEPPADSASSTAPALAKSPPSFVAEHPKSPPHPVDGSPLARNGRY
jgi:hypothetical protein